MNRILPTLRVKTKAGAIPAQTTAATSQSGKIEIQLTIRPEFVVEAIKDNESNKGEIRDVVFEIMKSRGYE